MKSTFFLTLAAILALSFHTGSGATEVAMKDGAKDPPRGADQPVGWRGNWTGKFLDANPPVTWSKLSKQMKGLRCQADKPKDEKPAGVSASLGSLTEWLVLGPFPATVEPKQAIEEEFIKDEANCAPKLGDSVNGLPWKKFDVGGSLVNFETILAKDVPKGIPSHKNSGKGPYAKPMVAYAHTWVYSAAETTYRFRVRGMASVKLYVNGEAQQKGFSILSQNNSFGGEFSYKLKQGWNRILCKVRNDVAEENSYYQGCLSSWYIDLGLRATGHFETDSEGIAWATLLPSYNIANPLIVGDKIFAMAKPGDLVCMRKSDGKVLWVGSTTSYDMLADKSTPAAAKIAPVVAQLNKIHAEYVEKGSLTEAQIRTRIGLHNQIVELAGLADKAKFYGAVGHYISANMPTPVSDGKCVYVWSELGIAVCYDLNGNRKWMTMPGVKDSDGVGRYCSPILADGKMIVFENTLEKHKGGLSAMDVATGQVVWTMPEKNAGEPFSSLVPLKIAGEDCVLYGKYIVRGHDGKVMLENADDLVCHIATPVIDNGMMFSVKDSTGCISKARLPIAATNVAMKNEGKPNGYGRIQMCQMIASPLVHDGLIYVVDQTGYLYVVDAQTQNLVYEHDLALGKAWPFDFYHNLDWGWGLLYASPILAGKHIYVFGINGTSVVFEPGREYKEVAKNRIEDCQIVAMYTDSGHEIPEFFASSPVAEGKRIYVRGGNYLYCLGDK